MHRAESGNVMDIIAGLIFCFFFGEAKKKDKKDKAIIRNAVSMV